MASIIRTNGVIESVEPKNGSDFKLDELRKVVDGWIEIVSIGQDDKIMVVNEEGILLGLPFNFIATYIAGQPIFGDVLFCNDTEVL